MNIKKLNEEYKKFFNLHEDIIKGKFDAKLKYPDGTIHNVKNIQMWGTGCVTRDIAGDYEDIKYFNIEDFEIDPYEYDRFGIEDGPVEVLDILDWSWENIDDIDFEDPDPDYN